MSKISELSCCVNQLSPTFILISETWLKTDIPDSICNITGYTLYRSDGAINIGHDGVCIYMKTDLFDEFTVSHFQINTPEIDNIFLDLKSPHFSITIGCIYRPRPSPSDDILLTRLADMAASRRNLIIVGDFNIPQLVWPLRSVPACTGFPAAFAETILSSGIHQLVMEPTRFRENQRPSVLDLLLTNDPDLVSGITFMPPLGKSDHVCITGKLQFSGTTYKAKAVERRVTNYESLSLALDEVEWENELVGDVDAVWEIFMKTVNNLLSIHSSIKTCIRSFAKPWITLHILKLVKLKRSLWQRFRRSGRQDDYAAHRIHSNRLKLAIKAAKSDYEDRLISGSDRKQFFKYVRSGVNSKVTIPVLRGENGDICQDRGKVANIFAEHFSAVFTAEPDGEIPGMSAVRCPASIEHVDFSPELVKEQLLGLKASTSPGIEGLPAELLKRCSGSLSVPLSMIMQKSFDSMALPRSWKDASVTPIFKKGDKLDCSNYRPVSIVPIVAKIAEKIVLRRMLPFLLENNIIPPQQHGFVPGRSVLTNLLTCINDWTSSVDNKEPVDVLYLDFSRAFDRVPTRRLLGKLEHCGVRGKLLGWIRDFLLSRTFVVRVGELFSLKREVLSGVPQGSVLGPVLFLVYVSDLPELLKSKCLMYADDVKIYGNPLSEYNDMLNDLCTLNEWCTKWLIPLNAAKCTVLHIGKSNPHCNYVLHGTSIGTVSAQNDLGVIVTSDLSWSEHILSITNRANRFMYLCGKAFRGCSPLTASKLLTTYVRPILEFAGPAWCPELVRDVNLLEGVQRRFTRLPYGRTRPSYEERLHRMNLPTFRDRRLRGDLIVTYRALHSFFGVDLSHMFNLNVTHLRGHQYKLKKQRFSTATRQNFLCNRVFSIWNSLPGEVVCAPSVNSFKGRYDVLC